MENLNIFISYSHENEIWLTEWIDSVKQIPNPKCLLKQWERKFRKENVVFWYDREKDNGLRGGDRWRDRVIEEIDKADIAILLVTQDFVISPFIMDEELPRILARHRKGELEMLPVLVQPTRIKDLAIDDFLQWTPGSPTSLSEYYDLSPSEFDKAKNQVLDALETVLKKAKQSKEDPKVRVENIHRQVRSLWEEKSLDEAIKLLKISQTICEKTNDKKGLIISCGTQGAILEEGGHLDEAMIMHKKEQAIAEEIEDKKGLRQSIYSQAGILEKLDRQNEFKELLEKEQALLEELNDKFHLSLNIGRQAMFLKKIGQLDKALELLKKKQTLSHEINDKEGVTIGIVCQAEIIGINQNKPSEALPLANKAYQIASASRNVTLINQIDGIRNKIIAKMSNPAEPNHTLEDKSIKKQVPSISTTDIHNYDNPKFVESENKPGVKPKLNLETDTIPESKKEISPSYTYPETIASEIKPELEKELSFPFGSPGTISALCLSPCGDRLVSASYENNSATVLLHDLAHKCFLRRFNTTGRVYQLQHSPKDNLVLIKCATRLELWDSSTIKTVASWSGSFYDDRIACFSPDGKNLLHDNNMKLFLYRIDTKEDAAIDVGLPERVLSAVFMPDSRYLVLGMMSGSILIKSLVPNDQDKILDGGMKEVYDIAVSPDGLRIAAASEDGNVRVWHSHDLMILKGHEKRVLRLAFSPDGRKLLSASGDGFLILWDVETGRELMAINIPDIQVKHLQFSKDSRFMIIKTTGQARIWENENGTELPGFDNVYAAHFLPDGEKVVCAFSDNTVRFIDLVSGKIVMERETLVRSSFAVLGANFTTLITADSKTKLFQIRPEISITGIEGSTGIMALSPDGKAVLCATNSGIIKEFDLLSGAEIARYEAPAGRFSKVGYSSDGSLLFASCFHRNETKTSNYRTIIVRERGSGRLIRELQISETQIILIVDSSRMIIGGNTTYLGYSNGIVRSYDLHAEIPPLEMKEFKCELSAAALLGNGKTFITGSGSWREFHPMPNYGPSNFPLEEWDFETGNKIRTVAELGKSCTALSISPNGTLMATGSSDNIIKLWDIANGHQLKIFVGHTAEIRSIAFTPCGTCLISSSDDQTIRIWKIKTGRDIATIMLYGTQDWIVTTRDGRRDLSPGAAEKVRYVMGMNTEPYILSEDKYYTPGLLAKVLT